MLNYLRIDDNTFALYADQPKGVIYLDELQAEITLLETEISVMPISLSQDYKDSKRQEFEQNLTDEENMLLYNKAQKQKVLDAKKVFLNELEKIQ